MDYSREKYSKLLSLKGYLSFFLFFLIAMTISTNLYSAELTLKIDTDSNDVTEDSDGNFYLSGNSDAGFGNSYWSNANRTVEISQDYSSYYRWITSGIKQGDTVNSATLTIYLKKNEYNNSDNISTKFLGIDEDNTPAFSSNQKPSLRPQTIANVIIYNIKGIIHYLSGFNMMA